MTFSQGLWRVLAAAAATAALSFLPGLVTYFGGPAPADVSPVVWGLVGTGVVFGLNYLIGKLQVKT